MSEGQLFIVVVVLPFLAGAFDAKRSGSFGIWLLIIGAFTLVALDLAGQMPTGPGGRANAILGVPVLAPFVAVAYGCGRLSMWIVRRLS